MLLSITVTFIFIEFPLILYGQFMEEDGITFKILTSKPTGKRPLGSPRHRWEVNIRMT